MLQYPNRFSFFFLYPYRWGRALRVLRVLGDLTGVIAPVLSRDYTSVTRVELPGCKWKETKVGLETKVSRPTRLIAVAIGVLLGLPAECRCAENGCIALFELGKENLDLVFVDRQIIGFKRLAKRAHEELSALGETAEDDEGLG